MIDLFCGAGGTTTGAEMSGICKVIAAVNHDPVCIESHNENHPDVMHFQEDIRTLDLSALIAHTNEMRRRYPEAQLILWASLECTNFSRAKGGLPRDADSRTLADHLPRYVQQLNPDYIQIENVEEFMSWGDLDDNGRPCSRYEGREFLRWCNDMCALGYRFSHRLINSADFGAYTSRKRLFGCFAKPGMPILFPEPTHAKNPGMFGGQPWKPVREVLDLNDYGKSIFNRQIPLVDKTIRRIMNGLKKHVPPAPMLMTCTSPGFCKSIDEPCGTLTTSPQKALVTPMLINYYGNGNCTSVKSPCGTITTKDRHGLVTPVYWVDYNYSGVKNGYSVEAPLWALTANPKASLCTAFIVNPQFNNTGSSINAPCPTIIATQKSRPLALSVVEYGAPAFIDNSSDSEAMVQLKALCRDLGIGDIFFRMLKVEELKTIQGFPKDYNLKGSKADQKKQVGNSVVPKVVTAWLHAMANIQVSA